MTKFNFNEAVPFEATRVGEVIKDELSTRNMKQSELSEQTGIQKSILNDVIKGKRSLTSEMAVLLESALGLSASLLLQIQSQYEIDCARVSKRVVLQVKMLDIWNVLKENICVPFFKSVGIIKGNVIEDVGRIFTVFNVSNLDGFFDLKAREMELGYYRKSDNVTTNPIDILSWKYYCYYLSKNERTPICPFDKNSDVNALVRQLNSIFAENNDTVNKITKVLNEYGIRLIVVKKVGQIPVDGMSFWIGDNPTVIITERIATIDNLAFTILHEVGHVYKHLDKNGSAMINLADDTKNTYEADADEFALDAILPNVSWKRFLYKTRDIVPHKIAPYIKEEADRAGVNPQILFGRYKHDVGIYKIRNHFETKIL